ncbi:uncharacterized protein LOC115628282 [Scaptodrosophila lebanonensis]|uniref:Uncharacterized protein LOC115628282 n=1 Tax=Drosophila lebanonensis TaxID=7225 RepID=A0A6J2TZA9_DROLE|nr:uncharacterized protein LOC115628282 [Scaptodrosophila lebanonensis]
MMNDAVSSSFYGSVAFQHPELSTPIHSVEHDNFSNLTSNYSFFEDEQAFLINTAIAPASTIGNANVQSATPDTSNYTNIPFVQIHTTDLQQAQPQNSYRNVFRRKAAEIKAEPIKSEQAEASKERTNATPTPPTRNSSAEGKQNNEEVVNSTLDVDVVPRTTGHDIPPIHKCSSCPFLSLCQLKMQAHIANCFGVDEQQRLQCPGCANIFYKVDALNVHLMEDHMLTADEITTLNPYNEGKSNADTATNVQQQPQEKQQQPKNRIFIKNVNCLREPLADYMPPLQLECSGENNDSSCNNNIIDIFAVVGPTVQDQMAAQKHGPAAPIESRISNQKISIKSVDVLREPSLLPFQFQLPISGGDQDLPLIPEENPLDVQVVGVEQEKPRPPKIYIRNVDILKEPMLLPGMNFNGAANVVSTPADAFQSSSELLTPNGPLPSFESTLPPLTSICGEAFSFDSVLNGGGNTVDAFTSNSSSNSSSLSAGGNFTVDSARLSALDLDFGVEFEPDGITESTNPTSNAALIEMASKPDLETVPDISGNQNNFLQLQQESAALPINATAQKQKIFIKNVDILKAPQFQQRHDNHHQQRGTLHLRTVDELNLMNRTEVAHLIEPNLEHILELPQPITDFRSQLSNSWPTNGGYDLGDDLDCIISDVETVQLETLTQIDDILIDDFAHLYVPSSQDLVESSMKHEWPAADGVLPKTPTESSANADGAPASNQGGQIGDVPPLVPVTGTTSVSSIDSASPPNLSSLPVPPLVPCAAPKPAQTETPLGEKQGRIYVANNLMNTATPGVMESANSNDPPLLAGGTSVRGRPYGAKRTGNAKPRKSVAATETQTGGKCAVNGCVFRFKSPGTLEYHRRCHNGPVNSTQPMVCPECHSTEFSNWNSLHTHLWRTHQIDMELYCCPLCTFKTPIYSRLVNTHSKIHSEERNYKCEQCGKAFKNTKQLKNHRRLHRTQGLGKTVNSGSSATDSTTPSLHRCEDCGAAFTHLKTLREHLCKQRSDHAKCDVCDRVCSSKSSLKLHMQTHQATKRLKCEFCDYDTNDHNALRRHRATHRERLGEAEREQKMYTCAHCDYKAIQSTAYQIHVQQKHPELASTILHKCSLCSYSTVNPGLLQVHQAKHETTLAGQVEEALSSDVAAPVSDSSQTVTTSSKIKVKSSLLFAHSSAITRQSDIDLNGLQDALMPPDGEQIFDGCRE